MQYYYFAASLPMIAFDEPPAVSTDAFLAACEEHLTRDHLATMQRVMGGDFSGQRYRFVREWRERDSQLRNALARIRATRTSRDAAPYLRETTDFSPTVERAATDAFSRDNPEDRERLLDRFRWRQLEEIAGFNPFSFESLLSYGMRLQIAERWAALNADTGRENAAVLVAAEPEDASSEQNGPDGSAETG